MNYHIYYDRSSKSWFAYFVDEEGNQDFEAIFAPSKEMCLIYLGMQWSEYQDDKAKR